MVGMPKVECGFSGQRGIERFNSDARDSIIDYEAPVAKDINLINHRWQSNRRSIRRVAKLRSLRMFEMKTTNRASISLRSMPSQVDANAHWRSPFWPLSNWLILSRGWFGQKDCDEQDWTKHNRSQRDLLYLKEIGRAHV